MSQKNNKKRRRIQKEGIAATSILAEVEKKKQHFEKTKKMKPTHIRVSFDLYDKFKNCLDEDDKIQGLILVQGLFGKGIIEIGSNEDEVEKDDALG